MKRILATVVSVLLVATMAIGGSIAYLQDTDGRVNTMVMGNVYIEQIEQERDADGNLADFTQAKPAYPAVGPIEWDDKGMDVNGTEYKVFTDELKNVVDKIVTVKNTGKSDAFVRTIVLLEAPDHDPKNLIHVNVNGDGLVYTGWKPITIDGVDYAYEAFTYNEALVPGEISAPSLMQLFLDSKADNAYCEAFGDTWDVMVLSQAVQTAGFDTPADALNTAFGEVNDENVKEWFSKIEDESVADLYISSAKELREFAEEVSSGKNSYAGKKVALAGSINLSGVEWKPINGFKGTFDGQGYTISNLTAEAKENAGFFGVLNGTVRNLKIENATVIAESEAAGVVAGKIFNTGLIENVTVTNSTVTSKHYSGGIVGYAYGSVKNCVVKDTSVTAEIEKIGEDEYDNGDKVGGIVGYFPEDAGDSHAVSGNSVDGVTLAGYRHIGGIVGYAVKDVTKNHVNNFKYEQSYAGTAAAQNYKNIQAGELVGLYNGNTDVPMDSEEDGNTGDENEMQSVKSVVVKNESELAEALSGAGQAGAGDTVIALTADMDLSGMTWTPVTVDGYHGADVVTVNGNGHTITGLEAPLFAGGFAGGSGIVIKNLTIADSDITSSNTLGSGAFIESVDSMQKIELINCHLKDSQVTGGSGSRTGGLIGWTAGYSNVNDGPVKTYVTIEGCSVIDCDITCDGSVGGLYGHAGNNDWTYSTVKDCIVKDCNLNSTDDGEWRVGVVVGTANVGELTIEDITESGNTLTQTGKTAPAGQSNLYGRFVPGTTGKLFIDGDEITV